MKLISTLTVYRIEVTREVFNNELNNKYLKRIKGVVDVIPEYTEGIFKIVVDETAVLEDIAQCLLID